VDSDRDCRQAEICRTQGKCVAKDGVCVQGAPSTIGCRASTACAELGRCTAKGRSCVVMSDADCRGSLSCKEGGRCRALHRGSRFGGCIKAADTDADAGADAGSLRLSDGKIPTRARRTHHCYERLPPQPSTPARLTAAPAIRSRRAGRNIYLEPLGLRLRIPEGWQPHDMYTPHIATTPRELEEALFLMSETSHGMAYPLMARVLNTFFPKEALLAYMVPDHYEAEVMENGMMFRLFTGLNVSVLAVLEPVAEVLTEIGQTLRARAHAVSCPPEIEHFYRFYKKPGPRGLTRWNTVGRWLQWHDAEGPWKEIGAETFWHAHGHHRSNWVDVRARRFGEHTVVVLSTGADTDFGAVSLEALLPISQSASPDREHVAEAPDVDCVMPPMGHVHYAIR